MWTQAFPSSADSSLFAAPHYQKIGEGVRLFNEQKYWECHEALEHEWLEDRQDPARYVYWAVIQVAAAMIHYRNEKLVGAQGMINKAREKFQKIREHGILKEPWRSKLQWDELEKMVEAVPTTGAELSQFAALFDFRFTNYGEAP